MNHSSSFVKWITILIVMPFMVIAYTKLESRLSNPDTIPAASITGATPVSIGLISFDNGLTHIANNIVKEDNKVPYIFSLNNNFVFLKSPIKSTPL